MHPLADGNLIRSYFKRIPQQRFRSRTGKYIALQVKFACMTWTYQLIVEFVIAHETSQMRALSGKGNEAAAPAVDDNYGSFVENDFFGCTGRDFVLVDGELRVFGIALGRNKKF